MSCFTPELMVKLVLFNMFKPFKAVLLLKILSVIWVLCLSLLLCLVCSLQPCDHLLGKGLPLGSLTCDLLFSSVTGILYHGVVPDSTYRYLIFALFLTFIWSFTKRK